MQTLTPEFATVNDAAAHVGVTAWTVRRWIKAGQLPATRLPGGRLRIRLDDLAAVGTPAVQQVDDIEVVDTPTILADIGKVSALLRRAADELRKLVHEHPSAADSAERAEGLAELVEYLSGEAGKWAEAGRDGLVWDTRHLVDVLSAETLDLLRTAPKPEVAA